MPDRKLIVGQKLWYVPAAEFRQRPTEVTVVKIGRRWAQLDGRVGRISLDTWTLDGAGYSSPGRCYSSEADWIIETAADAAWREMAQIVAYRGCRPQEVTGEDIAQAMKLLRLSEPDA